MSTFRFGSHLPVLMAAVQRSSGPIVEFGSGMYSTVYLHWACWVAKRPLLTLESKHQYYRMMRPMENDFHRIVYLENWDQYDLGYKWSVALVDHSPGTRRPVEIRRLVETELVVVHDTEDRFAKDYQWGDCFDLYKYRFDHSVGTLRTTLLSNVRNVKAFI